MAENNIILNSRKEVKKMETILEKAQISKTDIDLLKRTMNELLEPLKMMLLKQNDRLDRLENRTKEKNNIRKLYETVGNEDEEQNTVNSKEDKTRFEEQNELKLNLIKKKDEEGANIDLKQNVEKVVENGSNEKQSIIEESPSENVNSSVQIKSKEMSLNSDVAEENDSETGEGNFHTQKESEKEERQEETEKEERQEEAEMEEEEKSAEDLIMRSEAKRPRLEEIPSSEPPEKKIWGNFHEKETNVYNLQLKEKFNYNANPRPPEEMLI